MTNETGLDFGLAPESHSYTKREPRSPRTPHSARNIGGVGIADDSHPLQPEPFVDLEAVAAFLGLSVATLEKWRFRNEMPFPVYRLGRRLRFRLSEVTAWAESQTSEAAA